MIQYLILLDLHNLGVSGWDSNFVSIVLQLALFVGILRWDLIAVTLVLIFYYYFCKTIVVKD